MTDFNLSLDEFVRLGIDHIKAFKLFYEEGHVIRSSEFPDRQSALEWQASLDAYNALVSIFCRENPEVELETTPDVKA